MTNIIDLFGRRPDEISMEVHRCEAEEKETCSVTLNEEHELKLFCGEELLHGFVCSPAELGELCAGWLYSEGYCAESVHISEDGHSAEAQGICKKERFEIAENMEHSVEEMLELFAEASDKYSRSHGIHECVVKGADWHVICTDIGRHNAIDKAIGTALKKGYDLRGATMFSSGRINEQTVMKAARSGMGCLMSKAVITGSALDIAEKLGLKVLFSVKKDSYLTK